MAKNRTLKQALRLDLDDLLKMNVKELGDIYRQLGTETRKRVAVFEKHGAGNAQAIKRVKNLPKSPRNFKKRELARRIFDQQLFLSGDASSYAKYRREIKDFRERMSRKFGFDFKSMKQFEQFKDFADDVLRRFKNLTNYYQIARMYTQAVRVGVDIKRKTFTSNFLYWADQMEKLKDVPDSRIRELPRNAKGKISVNKLMEEFGLPKIPEDKDPPNKDGEKEKKDSGGGNE